MADNTIRQINVEQAKNPTTKRAIAIQYDRAGRYHERYFVHTKDINGTRYMNGHYTACAADFIERTTGGFEAGMHNAGFDPDALETPKVYAIPDSMRLFRWVLKDGTVVTCGNGFPQGDCTVLGTLDGHNMFVPVSNVAYVVELRG